MKHTVTRFEMNLHNFNLWYSTAVYEFIDWLKSNGHSRIDRQSEQYQNKIIMQYAERHFERLWHKIYTYGFRG